MPNGDNITKKQHYIPQTFLKGFSNDGKTICRYDLVKKKQQNCIPIKSVAYGEYLYEIRNKDGTFLNPNKIEKNLSQIESQFAKYKQRLENSVIYEHNYQTQCFLTPEEKRFWIFYIHLQMARREDSIKLVTDDFLKNLGYTTETDAKNAMLYSCMPFHRNIQSFQKFILGLFPVFDQANFIVGYDETESLFTNEKAGCYISNGAIDRCIYGGRIYMDLKRWRFILFPISSSIILQMYNMAVPENHHLKEYRNILFRLDKDNLYRAKKALAEYADKMILSPRPLSNADIKMIEEIQKNKEKAKRKE